MKLLKSMTDTKIAQNRRGMPFTNVSYSVVKVQGMGTATPLNQV